MYCFPSGALEVPSGLCCSICIFCVVFCRAMLVLFSFSFSHCIVCLSRFRDPDYPFGIFKLFSLVNQDYDRIIDTSFNSIVSVTTFCVGVYCRVCKKCSWFCNYLLRGFILHWLQEMAMVFVIK